MRRFVRRSLLLGVMSLFLAARSVQGQEMEAPAEVQIPLLYKILTFDRRLGERAPGDDIVIAVVFQGGYRASILARDQAVDAIKRMGASTISGHPVHWVTIRLDDAEALRISLTRVRVDVIYVTPLRGIELALITTAARAGGLTTFTGVPLYVELGLALGVGIARERPQILVNLVAARAEGSDFTSQLLRVSKVVEK
jgi:hypothetical protein